MRARILLCGVLLLALAFVVAHFCHRFTIRIKHRWQALSAGVAIAYVFANVIPELAEHRPIVANSAMGTLLDAEKRIYMWALAGFVAFAGLSRFGVVERSCGARAGRTGMFYWGAMTGWATYMFLIGYLLVHREDTSTISLWLYVFAMGLHSFMIDNQITELFPEHYHPWGRVLLMSSLLLGWAVGILGLLPDTLTSRLFAFVAGGVVVTSTHEEVPVEEEGRFWWFTTGAAAYATLLMLI